jgi:ferredoxin-NADP reductase
MTTLDEPAARVRVDRKQPVADGVVSLVLREVSGAALPTWAPGAHVDLVIDGAPTRQFSLCGDPADATAYRLGVLREAASEGGSRYVHDVLREGEEVGIQGPRNHFRFVPAPRYIFLAGGIGITPLLPMIAAANTAGADWRLVYGGRRRSSMAFLDDVLAYGARVAIRAREETGRMDLGEILGTPEEDTLVYACGPESLLEDIEQRMEAWPHGALRVERFSARPLTEPERAGAFEIVLHQSGRTLIVPPDRSILSIVEEAGVPVLSSCAHGTCGTCETALLEGLPDHRDSVLNDDERASNEMMMICISRAASDRLVLDL